ncbi:acetate--CoA ligase [Shewanella algae]|uniref:acetate--CoA ligase n=1 Tax=Shewanella algae TaxID=38313 RepID=UPI00046AA86B|nr:acetate--CoA ligase [Shewanella algae]MBO2579173.1 acetate--CoA ligase [Shewanella algae]MBO2683865.1 acetate--CoA ligase [Shewanella algae]NKZ40330.1 acetate--CoA ligase [Shewanella algae]QTE76418.1 acetate--CoA ligase [Shewanella algae]BCV61578.1 acetyl-coenzyme A synthetase [Shewanella algae]
MSTQSLYKVPAAIAANALVNDEKYKKMYQESVVNPEGFWREHGKRIDWIKPYTKVKKTSFDDHNLSINWFYDGTLNASANCLDRHLEKLGDQTAIIWEGDDAKDQRTLSYSQLHTEVCKFANALKSQGVRRGDVVTMYMPMVPEAAIAMLACARIGAVHSVVFGGFSPDSIASRIIDGRSKVILTADEGLRGGRAIPLKRNIDEALAHPDVTTVEKVIVLKRTGNDINWVDSRDVWWESLTETASEHCEVEEMGAEDPLFLLYTSGSTGNPKGVLHTTGGYMVYASMTHEYVFDYKQGEVYWCTADVGWITGHSYMIYGPLANGATVLIHEGVPNYPSPARLGEMIDRHQVNILYTAPTLIRALMAEGKEQFDQFDGSSLRIMGSVGEPINPEAWRWYHEVIGHEHCPIVDTWWQTETGGILISPLPGATDTKPGSATRPFFGVQPALVDNMGNILEGATEGNLVMLDSWPGQMRTVYGDHERFALTYFKTFRGMYFTGDGARRDEDGYYWITGRVDDVINVSGHRLGTAEIESALVAHDLVAEAAVVGYPHDIKGQGIYAYVTLTKGIEATEELRQQLRQWVRKEIGALATPDLIQFAGGLPKTRSGKIMRRFLRKIAANEITNLGDASTLADPAVIDTLIESRLNRTE